MLDPILSKRQRTKRQAALSPRGVLKNSCCEVFQGNRPSQGKNTCEDNIFNKYAGLQLRY